MKIRLGNDINLKILLTYGAGEDIVNVHNVRAIVVNTTLKEKLEAEFKKKNRFIGRFPIEPFIDEFEPTPYNIHSTGRPMYNVVVPNHYRGFGLRPDWKNSFPIKEMKITEYVAEVQHTADADTVIVTFPAEAQKYAGEYQLIIIALIYAPGYKNNVRTVCTNYNNVFELVKDSADADLDNSILLEISNYDTYEPRKDVYVVSGQYGNDSIKLIRNDNDVVQIDVSPISGWYENNE